MKKCLFGLAASLLLFGGIVSAQDGAQEEVLLEDVGFTVVGGEPLIQEEEGGPYVLITDGNQDREYLIDFDDTTVSTPGTSLEVGLCLREISGATVEELEQYYSDRNPPEAYLSYLLGALQISAEGQNPFAFVKTLPGSDVVYLCDGAVFSLSNKEDCVPMRIPGDYPNGTYTVSSCNDDDPVFSFKLDIYTSDRDEDGIADGVDMCPDSDMADTVIIGEGECDSGVTNKRLDDGCTISDGIAACEDGVENHGEFVSCVSHFTNGLKPKDLSGAEKGLIQSCAAQSSIGIVPCSEPGCEEGDPSLVQNRHRARYVLAENDLVIPCVEVAQGEYLAVDMDLTFASSKNFHFRVKKANKMGQAEVDEIQAPEECAQYDGNSNSLIFPRLAIGDNEYRVQLKLLGANSADFHFKLQSITEVAE